MGWEADVEAKHGLPLNEVVGHVYVLHYETPQIVKSVSADYAGPDSALDNDGLLSFEPIRHYVGWTQQCNPRKRINRHGPAALRELVYLEQTPLTYRSPGVPRQHPRRWVASRRVQFCGGLFMSEGSRPKGLAPTRAVIGLVVSLVLTLGLQVVTTSSASAAEYTIRVIHHNIGGGQDYLGAVGAIDKVNAAIDEFPNATVVTMNEVCASQRDHFIADHPTWWTYWVKTGVNDKCLTNAPSGTTSNELGEMIASKYAMTGQTKYCLMPDANGNRTPDSACAALSSAQGLLCAYIQAPGLPAGSTGYRACTTHLGTDGGDTERAKKTRFIRLLLDTDVTQRIVTVSGDFNSTPELASQNNMSRQKINGTYGSATGTVGDFADADSANSSAFGDRDPSVTCAGATTGPTRPPMCRSGRITATPSVGPGNPRKIDYVFFHIDRLRFGTYGAGALSLDLRSGPSWQHKLLVGTGILNYPSY